MISHTSERFRKLFSALPKHIQQQAREAYKQFKKNPFSPGLNFKNRKPENRGRCVKTSKQEEIPFPFLLLSGEFFSPGPFLFHPCLSVFVCGKKSKKKGQAKNRPFLIPKGIRQKGLKKD